MFTKINRVLLKAQEKAEGDNRFLALWWGVAIVIVGVVMFGISKI